MLLLVCGQRLCYTVSTRSIVSTYKGFQVSNSLWQVGIHLLVYFLDGSHRSISQSRSILHLSIVGNLVCKVLVEIPLCV